MITLSSDDIAWAIVDIDAEIRRRDGHIEALGPFASERAYAEHAEYKAQLQTRRKRFEVALLEACAAEATS